MTMRTRSSQDDPEWEDIMDTSNDIKPHIPASERLSPSPRPSPRKRKTGTKTVYIAASPRKPPASPRIKPSLEKKPSQAIVTQEEFQDALAGGLRSSIIYVVEVLASFFRILKRPLAFLLVLWAVAIILNHLSASLRSAFSPLCIIPGISSTSLCRSYYPDERRQGAPQHADYPKMVEIQSKSFEQLLDESVGGSGLALEIKKAEMATTDLVTLVRVSKLTSKDLLANALLEFVEDARGTARGLQKLSAKLGSSVDEILAVNDFALHAIEEARAPQSGVMQYVWPFGTSGRSSKELLTSTFTQSLSVLSSSLERLEVQARASLGQLDKLEEQLSTIHSILAREDVAVNAKNDELLAELWTKLGGNRAQVRSFKSNLMLLKELGSYRTRALAHVVGALQALQGLSAEMEELRERVAAPEITEGEIPLEVHVKSIRSGIERLQEGRIKAKEREEEAITRILSIDAAD